MNHALRHADLSTVLAEARLVAEETARLFDRLSPEQVNWKPDQREWSIGQCFDHLVIANGPFERIIEDVLENRRRGRLWERVPGLPRLFGRLLIESLRPDSGRRVRAPAVLHPSQSHITPQVVARFLQQQSRLVHLIEATRGRDVERIIVTSPVTRAITYSLMDAYRIIVVHEQNHFVQARRVMETPGFPGAAAGATRA